MWDWLFQFIDPLERAGIPYALVGSVASSIYGEPRATNDLDVVIQISPDEAEKLVAAFPEERRKSIEVNGREIWVAAPEAVILHKLLFNRESGGEKHLRDVRAMLVTLGTAIDRPWLDRELAHLGLKLPE